MVSNTIIDVESTRFISSDNPFFERWLFLCTRLSYYYQAFVASHTCTF